MNHLLIVVSGLLRVVSRPKLLRHWWCWFIIVAWIFYSFSFYQLLFSPAIFLQQEALPIPSSSLFWCFALLHACSQIREDGMNKGWEVHFEMTATGEYFVILLKKKLKRMMNSQYFYHENKNPCLLPFVEDKGLLYQRWKEQKLVFLFAGWADLDDFAADDFGWK